MAGPRRVGVPNPVRPEGAWSGVRGGPPGDNSVGRFRLVRLTSSDDVARQGCRRRGSYHPRLIGRTPTRRRCALFRQFRRSLLASHQRCCGNRQSTNQHGHAPSTHCVHDFAPN
jgi:hypothetical protein